jgi:tetratricopeptide (TPR) repeat protein
VTYKPEQEADLFKVLGEYKDEKEADRIAYEKANQEIYQTEGIDMFFAWYNRGTNMVYLQDYAGAAESFDQAFQVYGLIPENQRPWRTTWYRTEAYAAYYFVGRYQDVINLATLTINNATEPYLEENFFWRARAYLATGQNQKALDDVNQALEYHPGYAPALSLLDQIGSG